MYFKWLHIWISILLIKAYRFSSRKPSSTNLNTAANGINNYNTTSTIVEKPLSSDFNHETSKSTRVVVPNHVIPSDVPQEKHPNASYANNFIR